MSEGRASLVAIADPDDLSRAGIRAVVNAIRAKEYLSLAWETDSYERAPRELERSPADVLILSMEQYDSDIITLLKTVTERFPLTRKLLVSPDIRAPEDCFQLIRAGLGGYVTRNAHWFSRGFVAQLGNGAHPVQLCQPQFSTLTSREQEVLLMVASGHGNGHIANSLTISERTVRFHLRSVYDKLGVDSRIEAIVQVLGGSDLRNSA
jgi:DNA-binding NarL/FixJ family response regulator